MHLHGSTTTTRTFEEVKAAVVGLDFDVKKPIKASLLEHPTPSSQTPQAHLQVSYSFNELEGGWSKMHIKSQVSLAATGVDSSYVARGEGRTAHEREYAAPSGLAHAREFAAPSKLVRGKGPAAPPRELAHKLVTAPLRELARDVVAAPLRGLAGNVAAAPPSRCNIRSYTYLVDRPIEVWREAVA